MKRLNILTTLWMAVAIFLSLVSNSAMAAGIEATRLQEEAVPLAADPVAEKRLQALAAELRCLVCQNQTIADSNAELAQDLRREVRTMIQAGQSDQQIIDFMVNRYGDFVLYRPPVKAMTLFLWGGPILLLLLGLLGLIRHLRQRTQTLNAQTPLSAEALQRAEVLLKQKN